MGGKTTGTEDEEESRGDNSWVIVGLRCSSDCKSTTSVSYDHRALREALSASLFLLTAVNAAGVERTAKPSGLWKFIISRPRTLRKAEQNSIWLMRRSPDEDIASSSMRARSEFAELRLAVIREFRTFRTRVSQIPRSL